MTKAVIKREGITVEADLSFDQIKELMGVNGRNGHARVVAEPAPETLFSQTSQTGNWSTFISDLAPRAKQFLEILLAHPNGIEVGELTAKLGFTTPVQIGGVTGPGITMKATKHGIVGVIYKSDVSFVGGQRTRVFFPGPLLKQNGI